MVLQLRIRPEAGSGKVRVLLPCSMLRLRDSVRCRLEGCSEWRLGVKQGDFVVS